MRCKLIAYYRVSTAKQGQSGLGLEGQKAAVDAYARETGCTVVKEYTEVETGTDKEERPILERAIHHAKVLGAQLVIAKQDRLSRDVHYLSGLMKSGVDFIACDDRSTNPLLIHLKVAVAESEAKAISERTKAALQAYKARGGLLGGSRPECRNLTDEARQRGAKAAGEVHSNAAECFNSFFRDKVAALRAGGATLQAIADQLNAEGFTTRRGKAWSHVQVLNLLKRETSPAE